MRLYSGKSEGKYRGGVGGIETEKKTKKCISGTVADRGRSRGMSASVFEKIRGEIQEGRGGIGRKNKKN